MNLPNGLVAIPSGIDVNGIFAADSQLTPKQKRERAFVMLNELHATYSPDADEIAIQALTSALGGHAATITPSTEAKAVVARRHAREAAMDAIEAGYQP